MLFADAYDYYITTPTNAYFYDTKVPYTQVTYTTGGASQNKMDRLKGVLTMNFGKKINVGSTFAGIMLCALIVPVGNFVSAASEEGVKAALSTGAGLGYLAAALAVGLSCVGSGIAVAAGAPAAIGATSEDPKNFVKALIFVVLGEGIALYGLLIAILIISNVGTALGI